MKIAIDISPLETGHKVRGVGFYLTRLKESLEKYYPKNEYSFYKGSIPMGADVVHIPYFDLFSLSLPLIKPKHTIVTVHDLTPLIFPDLFPSGMKGRVKWEIQKQSLRQCAHLITVSEVSKKDIVKLTAISPEKISVVHLAAGEEFKKYHISNTQYQILKEKYHLPEKFALYTGDVTPNKNLPNLIDAVIQSNIPLVMVGKALTQTDYDRENQWNADLVLVQKKIRGNPLIIPLGFVPTDDLVLLYNLATVFVFPSLYEGFGLPVLEAMQCGTPVITTKGGSLPEIAGDAAYSIDGYDADAISKGLTEVFTNPSLQKQLSEKGIKKASTFSWKETSKQTVNIYEKIHH